MRRPHVYEPTHRLPRAAAPTPEPGSFMCVPLSTLPHATAEQRDAQLWLYRVALEEAQAVARPSIPERDLLAVWN